jgi:hypothetical protein
MKKISLLEVKAALKDSRFRMSLPKTFEKEINDFLNNPGCACHIPFYRKVLKDCKEQLEKYYPNSEIQDPTEEIKKMADNQWTVINCTIHDLENQLRKLGPGRKQLDVARYEDQITVVINELDIIF